MIKSTANGIKTEGGDHCRMGFSNPSSGEIAHGPQEATGRSVAETDRLQSWLLLMARQWIL